MYYIGNMSYDPNYLEHHGILGMKWGVRRFQNPDGSLTPAGIARYNKTFEKHYNDPKNFGVANNRAVDEWNAGKLNKFNSDWDKKNKHISVDKRYKDGRYDAKLQEEFLADINNYRNEAAREAALKSVGLTSFDQITKGSNATKTEKGYSRAKNVLGTLGKIAATNIAANVASTVLVNRGNITAAQLLGIANLGANATYIYQGIKKDVIETQKKKKE